MTAHAVPTRRILEHVARGAALLDRDLFGWRSRVDVARLDMTMTGDSLLGQVACAMFPASHPNGAYLLLLDRLGLDRIHEVSCGFVAIDGEDVELGQVWASEVTQA